MATRHKDQLRRAQYELTQYMNPKSVLCYLGSAFVLDINEIADIKQGDATNSDQVDRLITLLRKKPVVAYDALVKALIETDQMHVLQILNGKSS